MQLPYFLNQPAKAFELAAFLPSVSDLRLKSPLVQGFANLEQFGASQRQHAQNCSGSTEAFTRSPKRTPVSSEATDLGGTLQLQPGHPGPEGRL